MNILLLASAPEKQVINTIKRFSSISNIKLILLSTKKLDIGLNIKEVILNEHSFSENVSFDLSIFDNIFVCKNSKVKVFEYLNIICFFKSNNVSEFFFVDENEKFLKKRIDIWTVLAIKFRILLDLYKRMGFRI